MDVETSRDEMSANFLSEVVCHKEKGAKIAKAKKF